MLKWVRAPRVWPQSLCAKSDTDACSLHRENEVVPLVRQHPCPFRHSVMLCCCDAVVLWCCGAAMLWCYGAAMLRCCGAGIALHSDTVYVQISQTRMIKMGCSTNLRTTRQPSSPSLLVIPSCCAGPHEAFFGNDNGHRRGLRLPCIHNTGGRCES